MQLGLTLSELSEATAVYSTLLPPSAREVTVGYRSRTGALLRVDGLARGAFDREHCEVVVPPALRERMLTLEVERFSLPTNLLPAGPGLRWDWINRRARARPSDRLRVELHGSANAPAAPPDNPVVLWGHSHLDVAWLWTYADTRRKATRTFANAVSLLETHPSFVFMQSQPQLYEFVREQDNELFERVEVLAREGRFDADVAALWVESDCNLPSGESLLRQMLAAHRFCLERFGSEPVIAWLPDTFGFARTLPTLLAHAGIGYFATTKLQWNDTTRFPHPQFLWRGPDGSEVIAACIDHMDGGCGTIRRSIARRRREPLVVGYGDGGGGPTASQLAAAASIGKWERPRRWFERVAAMRSSLPVHDDELYLEYHRGVYTTHHDVKSHNAALERRLRDLEEQAAWCVAVRAPAQAFAPALAALRQTWTIVLRNQFHDVLPGTSIAAVYADAREEYATAHALLDRAETQLNAMLPRPAQGPVPPLSCDPVDAGDRYLFENEVVRAVVTPTGTITQLTLRDNSRNLVRIANVLAFYDDRPKRWEAWNIDAGYERSRRLPVAHRPRVSDGGLEIPFDVGRSAATMRLELRSGEPFLRVHLAIEWCERRKLLRQENDLVGCAESVLYGAPHGVVERSARAANPQGRARFEVPGQRFALLRAADDAGGFACFALDTYGWSARIVDGAVRLGHSLLRATTWPDPGADRGEQQLSWAYAPLRDSTVAGVERLWEWVAGRSGVRLFESEEPSVLVVACKPAEDGDGVIVRVRECNGVARSFAVRCGGRMREAHPIDALERATAGTVGIEGELLVADIGGFALRSFRVRF